MRQAILTALAIVLPLLLAAVLGPAIGSAQTGTTLNPHVGNVYGGARSPSYVQQHSDDDVSKSYGNTAASPDYWLVYDSGNTRFELNSQTDGVLVSIADSTHQWAFSDASTLYEATGLDWAITSSGLALSSSADLRWTGGGSYANATELRLARTGTNELTLDDGASGAANLLFVSGSKLGWGSSTYLTDQDGDGTLDICDSADTCQTIAVTSTLVDIQQNAQVNLLNIDQSTTPRVTFFNASGAEGKLELTRATDVMLLQVQGGAGTIDLDAATIDATAGGLLIPNGADPGATCTVGSIFIDTDETDDTNCATTADNSLCICTATDTWTALENN